MAGNPPHNLSLDCLTLFGDEGSLRLLRPMDFIWTLYAIEVQVGHEICADRSGASGYSWSAHRQEEAFLWEMQLVRQNHMVCPLSVQENDMHKLLCALLCPRLTLLGNDLQLTKLWHSYSV